MANITSSFTALKAEQSCGRGAAEGQPEGGQRPVLGKVSIGRRCCWEWGSQPSPARSVTPAAAGVGLIFRALLLAKQAVRARPLFTPPVPAPRSAICCSRNCLCCNEPWQVRGDLTDSTTAFSSAFYGLRDTIAANCLAPSSPVLTIRFQLFLLGFLFCM